MRDEAGVDDIGDAVDRLAIDYLAEGPAEMLRRATKLQRAALIRLRRHDYRPRQFDALIAGLARVEGVLAYAALDLGDSRSADAHARAAWALASRRSDEPMQMWVRGTQSLIARFDQNFDLAERLVVDGLRRDGNGTARIRLLAGLAQSRANRGDSAGATAALAESWSIRPSFDQHTDGPGIFAFTEAKHHYYAGSSLMWLEDPAALETAAREAGIAVSLWEEADADHRSLDDEALARIYRAIALAQLGDLDGAAIAVQPVLELPPELRISWMKARIRHLHELLDHPPYDGARAAEQLRTAVAEFTG